MYGYRERRFLLRLVAVYVVDWLVMIGVVAFGLSLNIWAKPTIRAFDPFDPDIGYPYTLHERVPTKLLAILAVLLPILCFLVCLLLAPVPGLSYLHTFTTWSAWKRKFYMLNTTLLGFGLACGSVLLFTDGMKNLAGRPRPDMLARCNPDPTRFDANTVGPNLVTFAVCQTSINDPNIDLRDGFRSFPSGHSSLSFAGLTYLSMFFVNFVFSLHLPVVLPRPNRNNLVPQTPAAADRDAAIAAEGTQADLPEPYVPTMLALLFCGVPLLLAAYIASTRYADSRHHGFDILFGSAEGVVCGYFAWRWYGSWSCRVGPKYGGHERRGDPGKGVGVPSDEGALRDNPQAQPLVKSGEEMV